MRSVAGLMKYNNSRKLTIEKMHQLAESKGGKCLSTEYMNANSVLLWQCDKKHKWKSRYHDINRGCWCPHCSHIARLTIKEMYELAKLREGECLSKEYVNNRAPLEWKCNKGHVWKANAHDIKSGHWCPKCAISTNAIKKRLTIDEMWQIAISRNGECLSESYIGGHIKLKWKCKEGHTWWATPSSVKSGKWCLICAGKQKRTIEEVKKLSESKGGRCLSEKYISTDSKLKWQCKEGHIWESTPYLIRKGHWCPKCSFVIGGLKNRLGIEEMHELAKLKDGKCLSEHYTNANTKLKWKCMEDHIWEARPNSIKQGVWCPNCARGVGERTCRKYFEAMFSRGFPSSKPSWLVTRNGTKMELDGYSRELNLAFEYQGQQHYRDVGFFSKTMSFEKRKNYDKLKRRICEQKGVILLYVPYTVKLEDIGTYIKNKCEKLGITVPNKETKLEKFQFYYPERIKKLQEIAKSKGGKLLSDTYFGTYKKLVWECKNGHVWKAVPNSISNGRWCPYCSHKVRLTIEEMQEIAKSRGGLCLSTNYVNTTTKLKWQCKEGHIWEAQPGNVKAGYWCKKCNKIKKYTVKQDSTT